MRCDVNDNVRKIREIREKNFAEMRRMEQERRERLADGLRFCKAYKIKIVDLREKWMREQPDLEQIEALSRFGALDDFRKIIQGNNKWFAAQTLNRCIREARELSQVWLSVEALRQQEAEERLSKGAVVEYRRKYSELRSEAFRVLGDQCNMCEERDPQVLEIDHRLDDGAQHRAVASPIEILEDVIVNGRAFYQLLCGTHHNKKTAEARERAKAEPR